MAILLYVLLFSLYAVSAVFTLIGFGKFQYVISSLLICFAMALLFLTIVYVFARKIKRYDIVDVAWGPTFIVVCLTSYFLAYSNIPAISICLLVVLMVAVWGVRLGWHIGKRKVGSKIEDARYVELRRNWKGNLAVNMYFRVYMVQAVLATIICIPVIHINLFDGSKWTNLALIGLIVWVIGFVCEVVADRQLKEHLSDEKNKGNIMQSGLWRYSRHPNYFGELTQWWGIGIIASGVAPWWVGFIGPLTISFLIVYVSGIPPTEKRFEGREGWEEYKAKTSVLVPLPVKKV